jgi:hypothetical protein
MGSDARQHLLALRSAPRLRTRLACSAGSKLEEAIELSDDVVERCHAMRTRTLET